MTDKFKICRVCGFHYKNYFPWGKNGESPTYDFCDCCGSEFGYDDDNIEIIKLSRESWIKKGMKWWQVDISEPQDYDPKKQLKNIPKEWL